MSFLPDPLHPAIIHFPIVLSLVALLFEVVARHPRARSLEGAAGLLVLLAAVSSVVAVVTGNAAHDDAVVPPAAVALVARHEQIGELAMWTLLAVAAVRVALTWRGWFTGIVPWVYVLALALGATLVGVNGYIGGKMVFDHGVGTGPVQRQPAAPPAGAGARPGAG